MTLFLPFQRATLLIPTASKDDPDHKHLFILLTNPHTDPNNNLKSVLLVSISTLKQSLPHDPACLLYTGDHPFIKNDSYVVYSKSRIEIVDKLVKGVNEGLFHHKESLNTDIFARVCYGLGQSRFTAPAILKFYIAASQRVFNIKSAQ